MKKLKLGLFFISLICVFSIVKAEVQVSFYAEGATSTSFNVKIEENIITLVSDYSYYSEYDEGGTITKLNSINGNTFEIKKTGYHLVKGKEWYAFDEKEEMHYYDQEKSYNISDIINELGLENDSIKMINLHANWESDTNVVSEIKLNKNTITLTEKESITLTMSVSPTEADLSNITWESSNTSVAEVDNNGVVKAKTKGTAIIKVKSTTGKTAQCSVIVNSKKSNKAKVAYNANGGKMAEEHGALYSLGSGYVKRGNDRFIQEVEEGDSTIRIPAYNNSSYINIIKKGYRAKPGAEWNTKKDGKGKSFKQGERYKASDLCDNISKSSCAVKLYINWEKEPEEKLTVTYNMNGGSGCKKSSFQVSKNPSKTYGEFEKLCEPTHEKYNFAGWFLDSTSGQKVTEDTKIAENKNHTLVAKWYTKRGTIYFLNTYASSESVLIRTQKGRYLIIDNGKSTEKNPRICETVVNNIKNIITSNGDEKDKIEYMVLSHNHSDHINCTSIFLDKLNINKIILKDYTKKYKSRIDKDGTLKKAGMIIDTMNLGNNSKLFDKTKDYLTMNIDNMKIHFFNYSKDAFSGINCSKKHVGIGYNSVVPYNWKYAARDNENNYYYYDTAYPKGLKKTSKEELIKLLSNNKTNSKMGGMSRYYYVYAAKGPICDQNANSLALLLEYNTNDGSKYAYLPSDLGNIGYGQLVNSDKLKVDGKEYVGNITSSQNSVALEGCTSNGKKVNNPKVDNIVTNTKGSIVEPILKVKKIGDDLYLPLEGENDIKVPMEATIAIKVKNKVQNSKDILVYQPTHHALNNDEFSVKQLGVDNDTTYHIVSRGIFKPSKFTRLHHQRSFFLVSKNAKNSNHFTSSATRYIRENDAIVVNFYRNGKVEVTGRYINCSSFGANCLEGDM